MSFSVIEIQEYLKNFFVNSPSELDKLFSCTHKYSKIISEKITKGKQRYFRLM